MWVTYYTALPLIPLSVAAVAIYTTPLFIALFPPFMEVSLYHCVAGWR